MLSKSEIKELKSLHQKKYREGMQRFLAEGDKLVREAIRSKAEIREIFSLPNWEGIDLARAQGLEVSEIDQRQLDQICELRSPNMAVALVAMPSVTTQQELSPNWHIYLDRVRDPGNLGTILRLADWYGINEVICSPDSVEAFNQKVIQASMGAVFRVSVRTLSEDDLIQSAQSAGLDLFATVMDGKNIHSEKAPSKGILLMGNEAKGLSEKLIATATEHISIPGGGAAESLNVGVATGILVDWAMRHSVDD